MGVDILVLEKIRLYVLLECVVMVICFLLEIIGMQFYLEVDFDGMWEYFMDLAW